MADDSEGPSVSAHSSRDKAFEIFVKRTITSIQKEAWGRSKEVKDIRETCQTFLTRLDQTGCTEETVKEVLKPLELACSSTNQKVVELALGCLHKLVAHAWLHGESTPSGTMDLLSAHGSVDGDDTVAQVIKIVIKCGETTQESLQLAVVRALLTFTTAEHFVAHGECLLAAVRAVFNLALGSDNQVNRRTACNALLQMLNTIAKRVTQMQPRATCSLSESSSRTTSDVLELMRSTSVSGYHHSPHRAASHASNLGAAGGLSAAGSGTALPTSQSSNSLRHSSSGGVLEPAAAGAGSSSSLSTGAQAPRAAAGSSSAAAAPAPESTRVHELTQLAEQQNLRALEVALEAAAPAAEDSDEEEEQAGVEGGYLTPTSLPRQDSTGTEAAAATPPAAAANGHSKQVMLSVAAVSGVSGRYKGSQKLTVPEKDVLLVLTAFCKLASREAGSSSAESVLNQGKLLALEMLAKTLSNPLHSWDHVREPFCKQLRQPLCLALLRNCANNDPAAFALSVRLLAAILSLPRLRLGLRAELGAFYPLIMLRLLEQASPAHENLMAALTVLYELLVDPQLLVDIFVNFDCDLQASNLYERTVQALSKLAQLQDPEGDKAADKKAAEAAQRNEAVRRLAVSCLLRLLDALEVWVGPIKDSMLRGAEADVGMDAPPGSSSSSQVEERGPGSLGVSNATASSSSSSLAASSEAEVFTAAKNAKESLSKGLVLFNSKDPVKGVQALMSSGLVGGTPGEVATFLRQQADQLDKAQLGELFGHHGEFSIAVMHAWVDLEDYSGLPIDLALRKLLEQFRLPGEAQKIDRIMEKFAERYCRDNPTTFRNGDAAYMLAFAIIMLNTDAHNPLAERRLGKPDFVVMNYQQTEEGMVPLLPAADIEAIYDRIVAHEIVVRGEGGSGVATGGGQRAATRNRLAAALGWGQLVPWRGLAGWDKQKGADAERRHLMEVAQKEVARAALSSNAWHTATHAEHARPMLQASGGPLLEALSWSFRASSDAPTITSILQGLLLLVKLAGLLGLDQLCELCVGALARASGVFEPAPCSTLAEQKQLVALQGLLGLAQAPEAGLLGSSWVILLRVVSALDVLKVDLTKPLPPPTTNANKDANAGSNPISRMFASMFGSGASTTTTATTSASKPPTPTPPAGSPAPGPPPAAGHIMLPGRGDGILSARSSEGGDFATAMEGLAGVQRQRGMVVVREAPGALLVTWAESQAGAVALEKTYTCSSRLDGDAVVVFMRALCAVAQEELEAGARKGSPVRLYSLQKVVECAYHNMPRIRFVWARLWAVIAAQLVGAACHHEQGVALYAVNALRQLVAKLLARAELAHFTGQEEALRPFVAVLRQSDDVAVRELAAQCAMQAVASHPRGLGSGWRMVLQALRLGAEDSAPAVMAQSQEALQMVVDSLYRQEGGHEYLRDTVQAIVAGVRNPTHQELSINAVQLLSRCGERLAAWEAAGHRDGGPSSRGVATAGVDTDGDYGWGLLLRSLSDILQHDKRPALAEATLQVLFHLLSAHSSSWDEAAWRVLLHRVVRHILALPQLPPEATASEDKLLSGLGHVRTGSFSALKPGEAGAAAGGGATSGGGGAGQQQQQAVAGAGAAAAGGAVIPGLPEEVLLQSLLLRMDKAFPVLAQQLVVVRRDLQLELISQLCTICTTWYQYPQQRVSTAGLQALLQLAAAFSSITGSSSSSSSSSGLGEQPWVLLLDLVDKAARQDLELVLVLAKKVQEAGLAAAAAAGGVGGGGTRPGGGAAAAEAANRPLEELRKRQGGSGSSSPSGSPRYATGAAVAGSGFRAAAASSAAAAAAAAAAGGGSPLGAAAAAAAAVAAASGPLSPRQQYLLQLRSRQLLLLQRALGQLHATCLGAMSWGVQMQLLGIVSNCTEGAISFNARNLRTLQQQVLQPVSQGPAAPAPAASLDRSWSAASGASQQQQQQQQQGPPSLLTEAGSISLRGLLAPHSGSLSGRGDNAAEAAAAAAVAAAGEAAAAASEEPQPVDQEASKGADGDAVTAAAGASRDATADTEGTGAAAAAVAAVAAAADGGGGPEGSLPAAGDALPATEAAPEPAPAAAAPAAAPVLSAVGVGASTLGVVTSSGGGGSSSPLKGACGTPRGNRMGRGSSSSGGGTVPGLVLSSVESQSVVAPALMRLESEGGLQLLQGLLRSIATAGAGAADVGTARAQLHHWCATIISAEAASSTAAADVAGDAQCSSSCTAGSGAAPRDIPARDALCGTSWEHAVRVPLVVQALQVISGSQGEEFQQHVRSSFPALTRLMCSNHSLIRAALCQVVSHPQFQDMLLQPVQGA